MTNREYRCRVCRSGSSSKSYAVREMMFGSREVFDYQQCDDCGSLQISEIPDEQTLARHYPANYYSYSAESGLRQQARRWLMLQRDKVTVGSGNVLGQIINALKPASDAYSINILQAAGVRREQKILDVGCGAGTLLDQLAGLGFTRLMGIDPFIARDMRTGRGVEIRKMRLSDVTDKFDVIMFNHSFEHVLNPEAELMAVRNRMNSGGRCIVRVPTPSSEAWKTYGTDWVQLDAPRHITLLSRSGMAILASNCGFALRETIDDSTEFGLVGSEAYRRDIPLVDAKWKSIFSAAELAEFDARARGFNEQHRGDQVTFILEAQ
jgi:SAM-dependent methyltransferase